VRINRWKAGLVVVAVSVVIAGGLRSEGPSGAAAPATQPAGQAATAPGKGLPDPIDAKHLAAANKLMKDGIAYLLSVADKDGGWSAGGAYKPAITAIVLKVLVQSPGYNVNSPEVKKGFEVLMKYRQKDGGFYDPGTGVENYTTALAVMALVAANDPQYGGAIREAVDYLKKQQIVPGAESPDGQNIAENDIRVGGVSYGKHGRPDLSNLGMWMDALNEAGVKGDDPAVQRALLFVTRCQNRSESNPLPWAAEGDNDGGAIYAPAGKGGDLKLAESMAGTARGGRGLRSYGSMTYVMFKSMLYANVAKDDPRVQAAYKWIRTYWRLDCNPNMPEAKSLQGLYYYYHVFAKALRAWGRDTIKDIDGTEHNWRHEMIDALAERAQKDGSWKNDADRWNEGSPALVTGYAIMALQEAVKK
jgi:squalene-hopene/tetraprenyl-beta-curcumene cyclase